MPTKILILMAKKIPLIIFTLASMFLVVFTFKKLLILDESGNYEAGSFRRYEPIKNFSIPVISSSGILSEIISKRSVSRCVFLLHFWATWCTSCREEMPEIESYADRQKVRGVHMFGIVTSDSAKFAAKSDLLSARVFKSGLDEDGAVAEMFKVSSLPYTFLVDSDGQVRYRVAGALKQRDELEMDRIIDVAIKDVGEKCIVR